MTGQRFIAVALFCCLGALNASAQTIGGAPPLPPPVQNTDQLFIFRGSASVYSTTVGTMLSGLTSGVYGPVSSANGYVPLWNGTGGNKLSAGLPVGLTGASTIVETDGSGLLSISLLPSSVITNLSPTPTLNNCLIGTGTVWSSGPCGVGAGMNTSASNATAAALDALATAAGQTGGLKTIDSPTFGGLMVGRTGLPNVGAVGEFGCLDTVNCITPTFAFGTNAAFVVFRANGTLAAPTHLLSGDFIGAFGSGGYAVTGYHGGSGGMAVWARENWTDTANGSYLSLDTLSDGTVGSAVHRMEIKDGITINDKSGTPPIGGDEGPGTLNTAGPIYVNGVAVVSLASQENHVPVSWACFNAQGQLFAFPFMCH